MLQTFIDLKLFIYGMIAVGVVGIWNLLWSNHFYNQALKDLRRLDKPKGRWSRQTLEEMKKKTFLKAEPYIRAHLWDAKQAGVRVFRMRQLTEAAVCGCIALFIAGAYAVLRCDYEMYVIWQYAWVAGCIAAGLVMLRGCMNMTDKEEILVEGWKDYFENRVSGTEHAHRELTVVRESVQEPESFPVTEQERARIKQGKGRNVKVRSETKPDPQKVPDEQIARIANGIRESAAADSRFAGALTPEEEKLLRDVIREYL